MSAEDVRFIEETIGDIFPAPVDQVVPQLITLEPR